jgi:hypothetical protein
MPEDSGGNGPLFRASLALKPGGAASGLGPRPAGVSLHDCPGIDRPPPARPPSPPLAPCGRGRRCSRRDCQSRHCAQLTGPGPVCRVACSVRLRRPPGYRAGPDAACPSSTACGCPGGSPAAHYHGRCAIAGPLADQVGSAAGPAWGRKSRRLMPAGFRLVVPSQPASGLTRMAGGDSDWAGPGGCEPGRVGLGRQDGRAGRGPAGSGHDLCQVRSRLGLRTIGSRPSATSRARGPRDRPAAPAAGVNHGKVHGRLQLTASHAAPCSLDYSPVSCVPCSHPCPTHFFLAASCSGRPPCSFGLHGPAHGPARLRSARPLKTPPGLTTSP